MKRMERVKMVKAMEYIARQINNEVIFEHWLISGVADGDIEYGDLCTDNYAANDYTDDKTFAELMHTFIWVMRQAYRNGGLYCDGVVSRPDF